MAEGQPGTNEESSQPARFPLWIKAVGGFALFGLFSPPLVGMFNAMNKPDDYDSTHPTAVVEITPSATPSPSEATPSTGSSVVDADKMKADTHGDTTLAFGILGVAMVGSSAAVMYAYSRKKLTKLSDVEAERSHGPAPDDLLEDPLIAGEISNRINYYREHKEWPRSDAS